MALEMAMGSTAGINGTAVESTVGSTVEMELVMAAESTGGIVNVGSNIGIPLEMTVGNTIGIVPGTYAGSIVGIVPGITVGCATGIALGTT